MSARGVATVAVAGFGLFLLYELARDRIARSVRVRAPEVFVSEFSRATPEGGLLQPLLGIPSIAQAAAKIAEQAILDSAPTLIGRKRTQ